MQVNCNGVKLRTMTLENGVPEASVLVVTSFIIATYEYEKYRGLFVGFQKKFFWVIFYPKSLFA